MVVTTLEVFSREQSYAINKHTYEIIILAIKYVLDNLPSVQRVSKELYFYASVLSVPSCI